MDNLIRPRGNKTNRIARSGVMLNWSIGFLTVLTLLAVMLSSARAVEVQRVVSPGGIEAWLVEDHTNPIIALDLAFRGGAALNPPEKAGLANMVASTIDEGAGDLDSQAFQGQLDDLSITLRFSAGLDNFVGSLRTLTENRDVAFDMLRLALTQPRFDAEPVERIRAQLISGLLYEAENPDTIVSRKLRKLMFPDHAYGQPVNGTSETIPGLTRDDLAQFASERFGRDQLIVGVVGDITPAELASLLDRTFGELPEKAAPMSVSDTKPQGAGDLLVIERNIPQSVVAFGHGGLKRDDPDYYAAYVVNYVLGGGGFASRLYDEVREKRGLAYSVYSYLNPMEQAGLVMGGVATQNARVAESLSLIRAEWDRMSAEGPTEEELAAAKTYLTGSFPLRLSSSGAISGMLVGMQLGDLGIDFLERRNDYIDAVTIDDARRVAERLYRPEDLSVVVVGQPHDLESSGHVDDKKS
ncbi:MAG: pitrilysin family protein [Pseudomonadota bacterium]